ncbi:Lecithin:cholesterol acyltransferase [Trichinella nativa]|uniref:Lecithin:cholesterol acyltransferase n=1 Tax=Trichinella nativa TaxID=6335 RepID=A0A1Y3F1U3_9BILA|nr:Lecithin:cholesterol acyltransferase [Trichinella nativa]
MVVKQFKYYFVYFVVTAVVLYAKPLQRKVSRRSPVIIGDGGNQLEARLNKTETVHYFCQKKTSDYFTLWLNLELLVPFVLDCWVDNMRLEYDEITGKTSNSPGVDIRVPGWGNTTTVEFIDPSGVGYGDYFSKLINKLVTWGYTRGVDVRAAPYDFRKAPRYNLDQWKLVLNPLTIRKEQRSMTSSAFLLPSTKLWSADEVLVTTVSRNYTAYDYKEFFNDIGFKKGWSMYKNTRRHLEDLKAPGVELHCLYGVDIPTAERLVYGKGKFPDSQPIEINGDGDGTVGIRSLAACMDWELMKAMVDVLDVIGLYVVINRNWSGKGDARFLAAGLGWSSADSLATRVVPFWTGARGTTFSWKYIQMCLESNYNLVYYVALATFLWLWTRREIPSFMKIALRSILTFAVFKAFLKEYIYIYYIV